MRMFTLNNFQFKSVYFSPHSLYWYNISNYQVRCVQKITFHEKGIKIIIVGCIGSEYNRVKKKCGVGYGKVQQCEQIRRIIEGKFSRGEALLKCHLAFFIQFFTLFAPPLGPGGIGTSLVMRIERGFILLSVRIYIYGIEYKCVQPCVVYGRQKFHFTIEERLVVSNQMFCIPFVITSLLVCDLR